MKPPAKTQQPQAFSGAPGSAPFHWAHWIWMAPGAIALSPIGTIIGTKVFDLDFTECLALAGVQLAGFAILYGLSNGGK